MYKPEIQEDHLILLLWNFMAIYHVICFKPELNDLYNFENIRNKRQVKFYSEAASNIIHDKLDSLRNC